MKQRLRKYTCSAVGYDSILVVVGGRYRGRLCWYDNDHGDTHAVVSFHPDRRKSIENARIIRWQYLAPLDMGWLKKANKAELDFDALIEMHAATAHHEGEVRS